MDDKLFGKLKESVREAGAYLRRADEPGGITFVGEPDPRAVRQHLNLTQVVFAKMLGISVRTLQRWEKGLRNPSNPSVRRLRMAEKDPESFLGEYKLVEA